MHGKSRCAKTGKVQHLTWDDAMTELYQIIQNKRHGEVVPLRVYPCRYCGRWELTSQEYRKRR